jgi:hypothetical protein
MFEETVSIDLGASYTKVAYRRAINPNHIGTFEGESKILAIDGSPLIPSLAIRTRDPQQPWFFGMVAAKMNPSLEMQVFQNWKADLFRPANDKVSGTAIVIAHRFFVWLKSKLESAGIDLKKCQTRIAMPAFNTFDERAELVARCMDLSGWDDPSLILKVTEPRANVIGMFAEGRNVVMNGQLGLNLNYRQMFGLQNVYVQAARNFALHGTHGNLVKILVVDIGAFTTDIASLTFDVTEHCEGLNIVRQNSWPLGVINELDKPMFEKLGARHGFAQTDLSFDDSEELKKAIHNRTAWARNILSNGNRLQLNVSTNEDFEIAEAASKKFAAEIWGKLSALVAAEIPERIFLTGGGSLIPAVAREISNLAAQSGLRVQNVVQNNDAPENTQNLQRLATALGGSNVVLQASAGLVYQGQTDIRQQPPILLNPTVGYKTCRCQGANKDCCFCDGRGFI